MKDVFLFVIVWIHTAMAFGQEIKEKNLTNNSAEDRYASYSPTGDQIIFESNREGNWDIYTMDLDGKNQQKVTLHKKDDRRPSWHPSGQKIIFESNRSGKYELYELHVKNKEVKKINIKDMDGEPTFAQYSPDGNKIAYSSKKSDQQAKIVIIDQQGVHIKTLVDYSFRSFYPRWSADGKTLLFFSRHETNNNDDEVYTIGIDGKDKKRLTNWPKHNFCPSWSNDGNKIAYATSMENSRSEIYVMDANGENQIRITHNEDGDTLPNWAPGDEKLLITGYRNGNYEICEIDISHNK